MRLAATALVILLLAGGIESAHAQDRTSLQVGVGLLGASGDLLRSDFHLIGGASAFGPWNAVGVRADVLLGTMPMAGGSAAVVLRWPREKVRPYLFTGYSYQRTEGSGQRPAAQDFGVVHGIGVVAEIAGREWYVEVSPRLYGNVFYTYAATRAAVPITIGLHF